MGVSKSEGAGGLRRRMPLRRPDRPVWRTEGAPSPLGARAMRYYRLWIYTCNTALLAGSLAFSGAAVRTVLMDFRRALIPTLTLYQPSFLYAYLALATQGGALQLLGCVAAIRLSERLLNAYWLVLLILLFGDMVLGAFWAFRFERMCQELRPTLRLRFQQEYGTNAELTVMWHRLQQEDQCCGVSGADDFLPQSNNASSSGGPVTAVLVRWEMPDSCCPDSNGTVTVETQPPLQPPLSRCSHPYPGGCDEKLVAYLKATASVLAILGYCVLAFLKLCFLGILRYEIREMIQKIRILRTELGLTSTLTNGGVPAAVAASATGITVGLGGSMTMLSTAMPATTTSAPPDGLLSRKRDLKEDVHQAVDSERESLLVVLPENEAMSSPPQASRTTAAQHAVASMAGSGTGGTQQPISSVSQQQPTTSKSLPGGSYEMREFRRRSSNI